MVVVVFGLVGEAAEVVLVTELADVLDATDVDVLFDDKGFEVKVVVLFAVVVAGFFVKLESGFFTPVLEISPFVKGFLSGEVVFGFDAGGTVDLAVRLGLVGEVLVALDGLLDEVGVVGLLGGVEGLLLRPLGLAAADLFTVVAEGLAAPTAGFVAGLGADVVDVRDFLAVVVAAGLAGDAIDLGAAAVLADGEDVLAVVFKSVGFFGPVVGEVFLVVAVVAAGFLAAVLAAITPAEAAAPEIRKKS